MSTGGFYRENADISEALVHASQNFATRDEFVTRTPFSAVAVGIVVRRRRWSVSRLDFRGPGQGARAPICPATTRSSRPARRADRVVPTI